MALALEMFAISPASGTANLSATQESLLVGKASWLSEAHKAGLAVIPTIAISRAAWTALGISTAVHAATLYGVPDEHRGLALAFWAVPHLIIAPILLWMARPSQG